MKAAEFATLVKGARRRSDGTWWDALCPAHEDHKASLSFRDGDRGLIVTCQAHHCPVDAIAAAVGKRVADLFHANGAVPDRGRSVIVAAYDYTDAASVLRYQVVRYSPKDFRCRRPDGHGWAWNMVGVARLPYRLPDLAERSRVYICEGEKDGDALAALGLAATTNEGGAGKWRDEHTAALVAAGVPEVVILPDNDAVGEAHAASVARSCVAAGLRVKILRLNGLAAKGDVSDWLAAGHTSDELEALAEHAPTFTGDEPPSGSLAETAAAREGADAWPTPVPVPSDLPPVPAFDAERLLPVALAPWVQDVAERAQCPPDFVAIAVIVSAAAVVGRQLTIRPKRHDDWTVVPNLWGLAIGRPGLMKTPAMQEAQRGLYRLIADAREVHRRAMEAHEFHAIEAKSRRAAVEKQIKDAAANGEPTETLRAAFEAARVPDPPVERRYTLNDTTVEKLGELLNLHRNGLLLFRDELSGFLRMMDREGHENDRAFYCEAWNGTGTYTYDRIARGTLRIDAACVSVLGGIQPQPLYAYLREAFAHGQDDGLIQRFQLMVYPDVAPTWRNVDRWPDTDARRRVVDLFQALDRLDLTALAAHHEGDDLPFLRFAPEAQARFDAWRAELEHRLRANDEHPVVTSHLAKYRSLCPSLALLFHLFDCIDGGHGGPVSDAATDRAIAWCLYLEAHARRVYEGVTASGRLAAAALAKKVAAGDLTSPFTARDVRRKQWAGLGTPEDVFAAIDQLEGLHWVRRDAVRRPDGGRPTTQYHVNPKVIRRSR